MSPLTFRQVFILFLFFLLAACSPAKTKKPLPIETLAVLPFDSESNDVDAPDIMQRLVYLALKDSVYRVSDIEKTNAQLKEKGIQDGGQLPVLDPIKIAEDLNVQGLLYGNVESFSYTNLGFYLSRKVTLDLWLLDGTTGEKLWDNTRTSVRREVYVDKEKAGGAFLKGMAEQALDKIFTSPLSAEAMLATRTTLSTLPGFHFKGFGKEMKTNPIKPLKKKKKKNRGTLFKQLIQKGMKSKGK